MGPFHLRAEPGTARAHQSHSRLRGRHTVKLAASLNDGSEIDRSSVTGAGSRLNGRGTARLGPPSSATPTVLEAVDPLILALRLIAPAGKIVRARNHQQRLRAGIHDYRHA